MKHPRLLRWFAGVASVFVLLGGYGGYRLWVTYDCECGLMERTPITILNPLREHQSQSVAERYVRSLQDGSCRSLPSELFTPLSAQTEVCGVHYPLYDWKLRALNSEGNSKTYGYGVDWGARGDYGTPLSIMLVKSAHGWQIKQIDTFY